jgi:hypothetical protein
MTGRRKYKLEAEREAKVNAERKACDAWWETVGGVMWAARMEFAGPLGVKVAVIGFNRNGEEYFALVRVSERKTWNGKDEVVVNSSGLCGRKHRSGEQYISSYTSGDCTGPTLQMALYRMTR